jgi:hypothetical protein
MWFVRLYLRGKIYEFKRIMIIMVVGRVGGRDRKML